jgi:hypothetical protein
MRIERLSQRFDAARCMRDTYVDDQEDRSEILEIREHVLVVVLVDDVARIAGELKRLGAIDQINVGKSNRQTGAHHCALLVTRSLCMVCVILQFRTLSHTWSCDEVACGSTEHYW